MKTSCSDIWTECQSCSETEEEEDDEGKVWPFLKLEGWGGADQRPATGSVVTLAGCVQLRAC